MTQLCCTWAQAVRRSRTDSDGELAFSPIWQAIDEATRMSLTSDQGAPSWAVGTLAKSPAKAASSKGATASADVLPQNDPESPATPADIGDLSYWLANQFVSHAFEKFYSQYQELLEIEFNNRPFITVLNGRPKLVVLTLTASSSVSDFSDDDKSRLHQMVADAAGVKRSFVKISLPADSVRITATSAVPASTTADALKTSLSSTLSTAADAPPVNLVSVSLMTDSWFSSLNAIDATTLNALFKDENNELIETPYRGTKEQRHDETSRMRKAWFLHQEAKLRAMVSHLSFLFKSEKFEACNVNNLYQVSLPCIHPVHPCIYTPTILRSLGPTLISRQSG